MTRSIARHVGVSGLVAVATAAAAACGGGESARIPLAQRSASDSLKRLEAAHSLIGPDAKALLDSGNVLFRKKQYIPALGRYREASDLAPQHSAPIFGIYMVARATNNTALADSALAELRKRTGQLPSGEHGFSDSALKALHRKLGKGAPVG